MRGNPHTPPPQNSSSRKLKKNAFRPNDQDTQNMRKSPHPSTSKELLGNYNNKCVSPPPPPSPCGIRVSHLRTTDLVSVGDAAFHPRWRYFVRFPPAHSFIIRGERKKKRKKKKKKKNSQKTQNRQPSTSFIRLHTDKKTLTIIQYVLRPYYCCAINNTL